MVRTGGITLIACGAILTFALTGGPVLGVDLNVAGVILMLAGAAGLLLPLLARRRPRTRVDRLPHRRSRQDAIDDGSLIDDPSRLRRLTGRESRVPAPRRPTTPGGPGPLSKTPEPVEPVEPR
ncbi:MAG: hypothetical protein JWO67_3238 [Streptosporangiaceae bacterium]|nr:hypothetical protein [Streptosporangiaceae bacterium]